MPDNFKYDVFLSHSSKDKPVVRELANRLKKEKLRVWFDESDSLSPRERAGVREEALDHSRVLVLCMSDHVFGSAGRGWRIASHHDKLCTFARKRPANTESSRR